MLWHFITKLEKSSYCKLEQLQNNVYECALHPTHGLFGHWLHNQLKNLHISSAISPLNMPKTFILNHFTSSFTSFHVRACKKRLTPIFHCKRGQGKFKGNDTKCSRWAQDEFWLWTKHISKIIIHKEWWKEIDHTLVENDGEHNGKWWQL